MFTKMFIRHLLAMALVVIGVVVGIIIAVPDNWKTGLVIGAVIVGIGFLLVLVNLAVGRKKFFRDFDNGDF